MYFLHFYKYITHQWYNYFWIGIIKIPIKKIYVTFICLVQDIHKQTLFVLVRKLFQLNSVVCIENKFLNKKKIKRYSLVLNSLN